MSLGIYSRIMATLNGLLEECEAADALDRLEEALKPFTQKVSTKAEARRQVRQVERLGWEEQLAPLREWLAAQFRQMEAGAREGRSRVRAQERRYFDLDGIDEAPDITYGVTVSRRGGAEKVYYVVNIDYPRLYEPHPVENYPHGRASYCGPDLGEACDRLGRRLLGYALRGRISLEDLYLKVRKNSPEQAGGGAGPSPG